MASRLRKAIIAMRRSARKAKIKKDREYTTEYGNNKTAPPTHSGNLPYPRKILPLRPANCRNYVPTAASPHTIIKSTTMAKNPYNDRHTMMDKHCLWIRIFSNDDRLLFNHVNFCAMHVSQMIHICTKLIDHLNLISRTNEFDVQKALGTLEETIIAQLTLPSEKNAQYPVWSAQEPTNNNTHPEVGTIAIIQQGSDGSFKGRIVDDYINTTFRI